MDWLDLQKPAVIISVFSAIAALSSAIFTARFASRKDDRDLFDTRMRYFESFRKWAEQVADILTEAAHMCDLEPTKVIGEAFFDRRHRPRICLSAMIDKGRWFFPNIEIDDHGKDKEEGYKGYRHEVLDGLVFAYRALGKIDYTKKANNAQIEIELTNAKRHFVGRVQKILNPAQQRTQFERITRERHRNPDPSQSPRSN